jgi:hypothetical protein
LAITDAERARRRERCLRDRPWEKATGPKTQEGKLISSQNALKHGLCSSLPLVRELARQQQAVKLKEQQEAKIRAILAAYLDRGGKPPKILLRALEQDN